MSFAHPWVLLGLGLCLLPWVLHSRPRASVHPHLTHLPLDRLSTLLGYLHKALLSLAALGLVAGLAGPRIEAHRKDRWEKASAIAFVLDASGSMTVPISAPRLGGYSPTSASTTRLQIALRALGRLVASRPKDALGLIVFGDGPLMYARVDTDHRRILHALSLPYTNMGGTLIDLALVRALASLEGMGQPGSRAVVLLSDGEGRIQEMDAIVDAFLRTGTYFMWLRIDAGGYTDPRQTRELVGKLGSYAKVFEIRDDEADLEPALQAVAQLLQAPVRLSYYHTSVELAPWAWALATVTLASLVGFVRPLRWP